MNRKIYDIVLAAPGFYHDAAVWSLSWVKAWLETRFPHRYTLGDSAYPQSLVMMTPYPVNQTQDDDSKCLFNVRHSSARMEMTECIYGMYSKQAQPSWDRIREAQLSSSVYSEISFALKGQLREAQL